MERPANNLDLPARPQPGPETVPAAWRRYHPAVPRHWLFLFAGLLWIGVGLLLFVRALVWLAPFSLSTELLLEAAGVGLAAAGYFSAFTKIVTRNLERIHALPERVCAFAFTAWRGYIMIGLMITIGVTLRNSAIPKEYLAVPYTAMGGMLLFGSQRFVRHYLGIMFRRR